MIKSARQSKKLIIPETSFLISNHGQRMTCLPVALTNLWLHVNTFFINVLILFRNGTYIKKYIAPYSFGLEAKIFIVPKIKFLCHLEKILSRERSEPFLPNFSRSICAYCLIVSDFLLQSCFLRPKPAGLQKGPAAVRKQRRGLCARLMYICLYISCYAFAALFFVAWRKSTSIAAAKRTPMGYATAVL